MKKNRAGRVGTAVLAAAFMAMAPLSAAAALNVRTPSAGSVQYVSGKATIDASNISEGYIMVKYSGSREKIKVQVIKGSVTYTYNLNAEDRFEVFPLSEGDGTYQVKVYENVSGNQYAQVASRSLEVTMTDPNSPFLYPNQYVNFNAENQAVAKGNELAATAADDLGIVSAVFDYCVDNISYDYDKAATVQSGYLPDIDSTLATGTGICFDYAALMTAMLRSQNIPTKLVIGYTGSLYHAWVSVYTAEQGWLEDIIYFDGTSWHYTDPTFVSTGRRSAEAKAHVSNAANYQAKYSY